MSAKCYLRSWQIIKSNCKALLEGKLPTSVGANPGRARAKPFTLAEEYWKYKFLYDQVTRPAAGGFFVCWMILGVRHRLFFEQTLPPITRRWVAIVAAQGCSVVHWACCGVWTSLRVRRKVALVASFAWAIIIDTVNCVCNELPALRVCWFLVFAIGLLRRPLPPVVPCCLVFLYIRFGL